ncbi:MAG: PAS domain S-box protein [Ignavibacteriales bacterium]|nr:PAS domain S-box protein [Ignavibacteriales bacterium]
MNDKTELKRVEERFRKISEGFLRFSANPLENLNQLTALCGELLGGVCALYNRLDQGMLCSWGMWNTPPGYNPKDKPEGHLCYDVIRQAKDELLVIRNLPETLYAQTDPNVLSYSLQTYIGKAVKLGKETVGSLCVVYQKDFVPSKEDRWMMEIIASAIAVEEKRNRAEENQRKINQTLQILIRASPLAIGAIDLEGKVQTWNPAAERMFGWSEKNEFRTILELAKQNKPMPHGELRVKRKDGSVIDIEISRALLRDPDGKIQGIMAMHSDITERKLAEEASKRVEETLKESEQRYRSLTESAITGVYLIQENLFQYVNPVLASIFGYGVDEIVNKLGPLNLTAPEDRDVVSENIRRRVEGETAHIRYSFKGLRKDGQRIDIEVHGARVEYNGKPAIIGTLLDITERKRAE